MTPYLQVALELPLPEPFDYACAPGRVPALGEWVYVPWGRTRRLGLVVGHRFETPVAPERIRPVEATETGLPRMPEGWLALLHFGARYYHCGVGELALASVPRSLRVPPGARSRGRAADRARERYAKRLTVATECVADLHPDLHPDQRAALEALRAPAGTSPAAHPGVWLLHGVTGSGKTEVYLRWLAERLAARPDGQALMLVPEIALTPQLAQRVSARFPGLPLAILHSDMPDAERAAHWLAAAEGRARIVLGTRLAVLAPLPALCAIVVDEEHDSSFRQQEGVRYSARDLAIALASREGVPVVLGSATPSLETWHAAERGRYRKLSLRTRAGGASAPVVQMLPLRPGSLQAGLSPPAVDAIAQTLARGEQALVFLNRRGYSPVLSCEACGWLSRCDQCDAFRVLHRVTQSESRAMPGSQPRLPRYRLICHHCAADQPVPRHCPDCGNVDLKPLGQGTQRLEEALGALFPGARLGRLDRDVAQRRGAARRVLEDAHAGALDLLVGTQMLAKGHDFRGLTLVVVVDADAGLFAADYRAPERLFANLMQVAGRAGRHHSASQVLVQTRFPEHPLFQALAAHDYEGFARAQLAERQAVGLPPFSHHALLTATAREAQAAQGFLANARARLLESLAAAQVPADLVTVCDPVPMPLAQARGEARLQMLIESPSRKRLHEVLGPWLSSLRATRSPVRWQLAIDPLEI